MSSPMDAPSDIDIPDLSLVPEDALIDELARRWDHLLLATMRSRTTHEDLRQCIYRGGWIPAVGLAHLAVKWVLEQEETYTPPVDDEDP